MNESPCTTDPRVLLIAADDTFAHVYRDLAEALSEPKEGTMFGGAVEFFDTEGRQLAPVFGPDWRMAELQTGGNPADPAAVQRRLRRVIEHVAGYLRAHPEVVGSSPHNVEEVIAALPQLGGGSLQTDVAEMPQHIMATRGGLLHNAMHAAGWTH